MKSQAKHSSAIAALESQAVEWKAVWHGELSKRLHSGVLHEAIINAFAHNDYSRLDTPIFQIYSNRFEITSFGGLVEGLTMEKFYEGTSIPRNREMMRIFKDLDFVEQLGSGVPKIIEKYGRGVFSVSENVVQTTIQIAETVGNTNGDRTNTPRKRPENAQKTNTPKVIKTQPDITQKILNAVRDNPFAGRHELAETLGMTVDRVKWHLNKLKKTGTIQHIGPDKGGHWEIVK